MRWTREEQAAFWDLWGEEAPPRGWRAGREWLAQRLGEDRALARWGVVIVGGDAVLATLALRAAVARDPAAGVLWAPGAHWARCPFVWGADREVGIELGALLGCPEEDLGVALARVRAHARGRQAAAGGHWDRCGRHLLDAPVAGGRVCVFKPRGPLAGAPQPRTGAEHRLARWWEEMAAEAPHWPQRRASMVGGVAREVWVIEHDKARGGWTKEPHVRDFGLEVSPAMPISQARSQWWDAARALVSLAQAGAPLPAGKDNDDTRPPARLGACPDRGHDGHPRPVPGHAHRGAGRQ